MSILNSAVSGMLANSNWLSNISQNVANANSTGYKDVATEFSALVDQSPGEVSAGAGVTSSTRSLNAAQGQIESTSTTTDLAIQGSGFFVVTDAGGNTLLTRDGSFVPDASGNLVNAAGYYLMGANTQGTAANVPVNSLAQLTKINVEGAADAASPSTKGTLIANLPSTSTVVVPAAAIVGPPAVAAVTLPSSNKAGSTSTEETTVVAYDDLGNAHTLNLYFTNTGLNAAGTADTWDVAAFDSTTAAPAPGGPFPYGATTANPAGVIAGSTTLDFDPTTGALVTGVTAAAIGTGSPMSITVPGTNGAGPATVSLDLSQMTQLAAGFGVNSSTINGNPPGSLTGIAIGPSGILSFQYANGASQSGYTIPLAKVPSPDNLTSALGDSFIANDASGPIQLGTAGVTGLGTIASSSLEQSTVDLATELTGMVEAQASYQANSKVFQTGSDILSILNNLKA
jgi:flagellar hook protein FlgE